MKREERKRIEGQIAELYRDYRSRIWYLANKELQNEQDAEDVVQEVFLFLIQNKDQLSRVPESEVHRYLAALVKNLSERRGERNNVAVSSYGIKNTYQMNVGGGATTEQIVIGREMLGSALKCFELLPEGSQEVLRGRLEKGSSSAEMAEKLNISENTLDARVSRARKKLKKLWMKEGKWNE